MQKRHSGTTWHFYDEKFPCVVAIAAVAAVANHELGFSHRLCPWTLSIMMHPYSPDTPVYPFDRTMHCQSGPAFGLPGTVTAYTLLNNVATHIPAVYVDE